MSYRKFVNLLIFIISILAVNLVTTHISDQIIGYMHDMQPWKATLIGMMLMVFVLYPAYNWLDDLSEKLTKQVFTAGKNAGGKFLGLLWAFSVALGVLFCFYLHLWFHLKPWDLF
jgi:hypothetical protein